MIKSLFNILFCIYKFKIVFNVIQFFNIKRFCFFLQLIAAPVMASLAVGIGVPILLFYVYGVVPVSLCRSGGCGVTTSSNGVHFDFDEEHSAPKTVNVDFFTTTGN